MTKHRDLWTGDALKRCRHRRKAELVQVGTAIWCSHCGALKNAGYPWQLPEREVDVNTRREREQDIHTRRK